MSVYRIGYWYKTKLTLSKTNITTISLEKNF